MTAQLINAMDAAIAATVTTAVLVPMWWMFVWRHKHRWKVTGAAQLMWIQTKCPCTEVLLVCDCGEVKTENLTGHWELEQLLPQSAKGEADREFFRKLGVRL
jgi:aspartokinase-like uncharacterized kinase